MPLIRCRFFRTILDILPSGRGQKELVGGLLAAGMCLEFSPRGQAKVHLLSGTRSRTGRCHACHFPFDFSYEGSGASLIQSGVKAAYLNSLSHRASFALHRSVLRRDGTKSSILLRSGC